MRFGLAALLVPLLSALGAMAAEPAVISIDPRLDRGPVNRLVLGHNIEAGNANGIFGRRDSEDPRAGMGVWDVAGRRPVPDTLAWATAMGMGLLRYPGGCLAHDFDWRKAIGRLEERPYFTFGLDEYLAFCAAAGAEPLITVSEREDAAGAAALVEYCNAPADAAHPWAQRRAAAGHPRPWGVRWFELGNETDHGNHAARPARRWRQPEDYVAWARACAGAMRAIDAGVRVTLHLGTVTPVGDPWNARMLTSAGDLADAIALHAYTVGSPAEQPPVDLMGRAILASTDQMIATLAEYRDLIRSCTGRDIPLAVTEYNAGAVQEKPLPWRLSLAAALHSADQVRAMLAPEANVAMACYWQFLNGYWGFLRGPAVPPAEVQWRTTAAAPVFRLWGAHAGARLVGAQVAGAPRTEFVGYRRVLPARGVGAQERELARAPLAFSAAEGPGWRLVPTATGAEVVIEGLTGKRYADLPAFPQPPGTICRATWEQRVDFLDDCPAFRPGMGLGDVRGYDATRAVIAAHYGTLIGDGWERFETELAALPDGSAMRASLRLEGGEIPARARIAIRNAVRTTLAPRAAPAYPTLTVHAALDQDGRTLQVLVFNKAVGEPVQADLQVVDASLADARAWCVAGAPEDTVAAESLGGAPVADIRPAGFRWTFPPCSLTAFTCRRAVE